MLKSHEQPNEFLNACKNTLRPSCHGQVWEQAVTSGSMDSVFMIMSAASADWYLCSDWLQ